LLADYGPELPPRLGALTWFFKYAVAPALIVVMLLNNWLRVRAGVAVEKNAESSQLAGVFAVWVGVAIGVAVVASDAMGVEKKSGPIMIAAAIAWAVYSLRTRSSTPAAVEPSDIPHAAKPEDVGRDRLSRFVDIPEELESDLRGVGWVLTLVYMAVIVAPFGTYIIADQVSIPFVEWIIGFFGLAAVLVFPSVMRAALDLNWLPISRRRPGPAMLMATSLAVVPWNPLLVLLLPWTIPAYRRVRRPDVLSLIGVAENDPRTNGLFAVGVLKKPAFLLVIAVIVLAVGLEGLGISKIEDQVRVLFEEAGVVSTESPEHRSTD
jgi:hypothetical protein